MPPERHLCPCSGYAGFFGFFARRTSAPKKVDCVQIDPHCQCLQPPFSHICCLFSVLFMATSWQLQNCTVFHIFSSAANHLSLQWNGNFRLPANHKRGIRSAKWIASHRYYQVHKYVPSLVTTPDTSLEHHIPPMPHPFSCATSALPFHWFSSMSMCSPHPQSPPWLHPFSCAHLSHLFSHQVPLILQHINALASSLIPTIVALAEFVSDC